MLRIVFMGSPDFALPSLEKLVASEHQILAVASNPDKRRGRGNKLSPTPIKAKAMELDLNVIDVDSTRDPEFADQLKELNPDLLVVVAFRILPREVLEIPAIGSVNLHASLLPKYRGAAPIHWAVMKGEKETGCTVFFLDEKVDTGAVINQVKTPVGPDETTGEVYKRLKKLGAELLMEAIDKIDKGKTTGKIQDESLATPAPKLFREDAKLNFSKSSLEIHNKIRGLSPFPTAWTTYDGEKLNIYRSKVGPDLNLEPGELALDEGKLLAGCGNGTVELLELQLPGKKKMTGIDFANGYDLSVRLGN